jgi:hypothetical protein
VRAAVDGPTTPVRRGYAAGTDIIGNGAPADRPHGRDLPRERDAEAHLDLDAEPDPVAAPPRGRLLPDLLSASRRHWPWSSGSAPWSAGGRTGRRGSGVSRAARC